jgi:hypothetical protein
MDPGRKVASGRHQGDAVISLAACVTLRRIEADGHKSRAIVALNARGSLPEADVRHGRQGDRSTRDRYLKHGK